MQSKVAPYAATPDPTYGRPAAGHASGAAGAVDAAAPEEADLRLVIEEDRTSGSYVYKTFNRRTGEVVQQLPQEELLRMQEDIAYQAGEVIRTKA
jgi:flagellar protein FlaG